MLDYSISIIHAHTFKITAWGLVFDSRDRSSSNFFSRGMGSEELLLLGFSNDLGKGYMGYSILLEGDIGF